MSQYIVYIILFWKHLTKIELSLTIEGTVSTTHPFLQRMMQARKV